MRRIVCCCGALLTAVFDARRRARANKRQCARNDDARNRIAWETDASSCNHDYPQPISSLCWRRRRLQLVSNGLRTIDWVVKLQSHFFPARCAESAPSTLSAHAADHFDHTLRYGKRNHFTPPPPARSTCKTSNANSNAALPYRPLTLTPH